MVFDITDRNSYKKAIDWINEIRINYPNILLLMVGNKIDQNQNRLVNESEALKLNNKVLLILFLLN